MLTAPDAAAITPVIAAAVAPIEPSRSRAGRSGAKDSRSLVVSGCHMVASLMALIQAETGSTLPAHLQCTGRRIWSTYWDGSERYELRGASLALNSPLLMA